jgi:hypothetical protein
MSRLFFQRPGTKKHPDFPPPVGMITTTSLLFSQAFTTSTCWSFIELNKGELIRKEK